MSTFFTQTRGNSQWRQSSKLSEGANAPEIQRSRKLWRSAQKIGRQYSKNSSFMTGRQNRDASNSLCGMNSGIWIGSNRQIGGDSYAALYLHGDLLRRPVDPSKSSNIEYHDIQRSLLY